jgi:ribosomal protein S18 acetylase RimI-like enzyme
MTQITLKKATESDEKFIEKLYFSTRKDEFAILGWSEIQLEMFLKMQFESQQQSYKMQFPEAESSVIKKGEISVGRLIVERTKNEIRLVDIALLPEFRGQEIGGEIIKDLISEAENRRLPLTLTVLKTNDGALRLYQRLGFKSVADDAIYISMENRR